MLDNSTLRQLEHMQQYLKRHSASATTACPTKATREMRESRDLREIRESRELRETREMREPRELREMRDVRDLRDSRADRDAHEYARLIDSGAGGGGSGRNASNVGNVGAGSSGIASSGNKSQHTESYIKYAKSSHDVILDENDGLDNNSPQHSSKLIDVNFHMPTTRLLLKTSHIICRQLAYKIVCLGFFYIYFFLLVVLIKRETSILCVQKLLFSHSSFKSSIFSLKFFKLFS